MATIFNERPLSMYDNLNVHAGYATKETTNPTNGLISYEHNGRPTMINRHGIELPFNNEDNDNDNDDDDDENNKTITTLQQTIDSINEIITPSKAVPAITTAPAPAAAPAPVSAAVAAVKAVTTATTKIREKSLTLDSTKRHENVGTTTTTTTIVAPLPVPAGALTTSPIIKTSNDRLTNEMEFSQQTSSEWNETAGHNIAAVKAALNEAKSKFFGLSDINHHQQHLSAGSATSLYFNEMNDLERNSRLNETKRENNEKVEAIAMIEATTPKSTSTPTPTASASASASLIAKPKYQNIPENSAVYRQHLQQQPLLSPSTASYKFISNNNNNNNNNNNHNRLNMNDIIMEADAIGTATEGAAATAGATGAASAGLGSAGRVMYKHQLYLNEIDSNTAQPSQAVYMATTVPQNIKGSKIAGRHTPTRSSLRHSRMLVVNNKNYRDGQHSHTMKMNRPRLIRWLIILQILIASILIGLSIWQFLLAPNASIQDNSYWSALVLLFGGILNLNLIRHEHLNVKRYKGRDNCLKFLRINSHVLTLLALILCIAALILASLHLTRLSANDTKCESSNILLEQGSCTCTFHYMNNTNDATIFLASNDIHEDHLQYSNESYKYEYRDLSCQEVSGIWRNILIYSIFLNSIVTIVIISYILIILYYNFKRKTKYNSIPTNL